VNGRLWVWFLIGAAVVLGLWLLAWAVPLAINATGEAILGPSGLLGRAGQRQLAGVRSEMKIGMSRQEVYARLRARNLVAGNTAYAIDRRDPRTGNWFIVRSGDWPPASFMGVGMNGKPYVVNHAEVWVPIGIGMPALGCGLEVDLTIKFDDRDAVNRLDYSEPQEECM
jgi:hypothetical protein